MYFLTTLVGRSRRTAASLVLIAMFGGSLDPVGELMQLSHYLVIFYMAKLLLFGQAMSITQGVLSTTGTHYIGAKMGHDLVRGIGILWKYNGTLGYDINGEFAIIFHTTIFYSKLSNPSCP